MARLWVDKVIQIDVLILFLNKGLVDSRQVALNTWTENRDVLIVARRPAVKGTSLVLAHLLAMVTIDTEATVSKKDAPSTCVVLYDVKDSALFPLNLVVHVTDEVHKVQLLQILSSPLVVLFGLGLKLGNVGGPAIQLDIVVGWQIGQHDGQAVPVDRIDLPLHPAVDLVFVVGDDVHVYLIILLEVFAPLLPRS